MSDEDNNITLSTKQFRTIIAGIVSGVLFIGGIAGTGVIRWDKFGATDFEARSKSMMERVDFKLRVMKHEIRSEMPPYATRQRIRNIERFLEQTHPEFKREVRGWQ